MSAETIGIIVGAVLGAGGLGAVLAFLGARRLSSGQVATTNADRLWQQSDKLIEMQGTKLERADARAERADQRIFLLEQEKRECMNRVDLLEGRVRLSEERLALRADRDDIAEVGRAVANVAAKVDVVHGEVQTKNGLMLGELADARETRRIEEKDAADRTAAEEKHVEVVPPAENGGSL